MTRLLILTLITVASLALVGSASAGQIMIPKIGLKDRVGIDLNEGPQWQWGWRPGENHTVWIAGHRTTHSAPFRYINTLVKGDKIFIKNDEYMFRYEVVNVKVIPSTYVYKPQLGQRLMLSACARADGSPTSAYYRVVVFAKLVSPVPFILV